MKKTILIVDDQAENIASARRQLGSFCTLITATTFSAVRELLDINTYDAVFTDVMMPGETTGVSPDSPGIGKDTPYGLVIAIMALNRGVKAVSIVTNYNHHSGPIPWALDSIHENGNVVNRLGMNGGEKDWRGAYEYWFGKPQEIEEEPEKRTDDVTLLIIGKAVDKGYIDHLRADLRVNILFLVDTQQKEIVECVSNNACTHLLLLAELDEKAEHSTHYGGKLHSLLSGMISPEKKLLTAGFMDYKGTEAYLRIPFTSEELKQTLGL